MFTIDIIVPVLNRPKNVASLINSFINNSPLDKTKMYFVTNVSCQEEINEINKFKELHPENIFILLPEDKISWAKRINYGILNTTADWVLCGADDVIFHSGWFEAAEETSKDFVGIIGTNDMGHPNHGHTTHPIVSREYVNNFGTIDEKGKFCHEGYIHNYVDVEFVTTAHKRSRFKRSNDCKIEHMHPAWNKGIDDDVYQVGQKSLNQDRALWIRREQIIKRSP